MSVTEAAFGPSPAVAPEFERTPPQDIAAEQGVLGGMLLSKDAIADVIEVVKSPDFYRPAHQLVYDAILDIYGRGEPADAVTVSAELVRTGQLGKVGGAPYLHTLIESVPTAANAGYYAEIVRERAILRRLVEAGTRIVQLAYGAAGGAGGEVSDVVDRAQAAVYDVTEVRRSEDCLALEQLLPATYEELESIESRDGSLQGAPTGFADLDLLTNGLHPGQLVVVAARPAIGKALALDTPLPTPTGWTTMGAVQVGDSLLSADGRPTLVVAATEVMHGRSCFEMTFCDGTKVVADADHQWPTEAGAEIRTTAEIAATMRRDAGGRPSHHRVPNARPLALPEAVLPLDPYVLGTWLAAGQRNSARIEPAGAVAAALRSLGVLGDKHLPQVYLRGAESQRRALLAGLLDTAGAVSPTGCISLDVGSARMALGVEELLVGLGYRCASTAEPAQGARGPCHGGGTVTFSTDDAVFRLEHKRLAHKEHVARSVGSPDLPAGRLITGVRAVTSVPVRCVQVDNVEHLYLVSRSLVPTHNSTLALDFARAAAIKNSQAAVIFSLEMSRSEITMRLLSAEARVPLHHMRTGHMSDEDWQRLARRMGEVAEAPLFIDDSPNLSMMEIRAKARRLKQRHDLRLVIIDYLQLMSSVRRVENRQQEVSEISRALKLLAKELNVPVVALTQLNRGPEQRQDKKPLLSDLRESGAIEQDSDVVILLHREDAYEKESPRAGEADLIVAKHRNGPTATVTVAFQGHYSRFVDMQR